MHDDREHPMCDEPMDASIDDGSDDLVIRRASRELQAPVTFGADFDARVMAAVRAAAADDGVERRIEASGVRRAWAWVVRPRTLSVSPLAGLAVAAGLAAVMVGVARQDDAPVPPSRAAVVADAATAAGTPVTPAAGSGTPQASQVQQVQFVLVAPAARSVALVGDFNDWNATPLAPVRAGGVWTVTVPLAPGKYTYNFVVDGTRMMPDPAAPEAPADDFGSPASIVTVAGAQS